MLLHAVAADDRQASLAAEPLSLAHRAELEPMLAARWTAQDLPEQTLSDPWFANLYLFRAVHGWQVLRTPLPCISGRSYDGARILIPLFELQWAPPDALKQLLQDHDAFAPLSSTQAARLDAARFMCHSLRDEADYLYPAENFTHYRGAALHKKRNLVRQLQVNHSVQAIPYTAALACQARKVLAGWMADKGKQPGEADEAACLEALELSGTLGLQGFLYCVDGEPAGFVLAQVIRAGVAVMRFAKGRDACKGIYQHMFQYYCQASPNVRWLNFEQDLGLPNFRRTKLSYKPAALLAKQRVTLRN